MKLRRVSSFPGGMNIMKLRVLLTLLFVVVVGVTIGGRAAAAAPLAPTALAPADGASVLVPFAISWSAVSDPSGIIAYNWQVSPSSTFSPVVALDSTVAPTDIVSGLANGTYFWRVQAVNGAFQQGAWSQPRRFTLTGVGAGAPGTPVLAPPRGYSTFHPWEFMLFNWSAVPDAATYVFEAATDPSFPVSTRIHMDNIPGPTDGLAIGDPQGNYFARVFAVNADGINGAPSNVIPFSVFYSNPLPPPPTPLSPANGTTLTLPVTLTWTPSPNPQVSGGYDLQIAKDASFSTIEESMPQLNDPSRTVLSLTPGTKFWRVHSVQGNASPTTAAVTAWSQTGTFTISAAPATPVSVTLAKDPLYSGETTWVQVQLTAAVPAGGATIALTSSDPTVLPVPPTITMPGNTAWTQFELTQFAMKAGQVTSPTPVTITATLNSGAGSGQFTVLPASLNSISTPFAISGGAGTGGLIQLNGEAPATGAIVSLSSSSAAVSVPASVTVPPGSFSAPFSFGTNAVTTNTAVTITASWNGISQQSQITVTPQQAPESLTLSPTSTIGLGGSSFGTVTVATPPLTDLTLQVTSSHPAIARVNNTVLIPGNSAGVVAGGFNIFTSAVTAPTVVTISVTGGGVTRSATLTVNPTATAPPPPVATLSSFSVSPTSVTGGTSSRGTVTLTAVAPAGGSVVTLSSSTAAATVPARVSVAAGARSASFTIATSAVTTSTPVTITASGGVTRTATLTLTPPAPTVTPPAPTATPPGPSVTLTVTASGRSGERVVSSPAGISVAVGGTGSAPFATGTAITLSVSNGRQAVWSGACSSGGNKTSTCRFTINGDASVSASVQ